METFFWTCRRKIGCSSEDSSEIGIFKFMCYVGLLVAARIELISKKNAT
jgi:hypothetical protein